MATKFGWKFSWIDEDRCPGHTYRQARSPTSVTPFSHLSVNLSLSFYLFTYRSIICLPIYPSIYLSAYRSIHPSIYQFLYLSACPSISLFIYLSIYPSIHLPICLSLSMVLVCVRICLSTSLPLCLSVYLSAYLFFSVYLSVYSCLSVSLSVCQSVSLSVCQSVNLSVCLSVCLQTHVELPCSYDTVRALTRHIQLYRSLYVFFFPWSLFLHTNQKMLWNTCI